MGKIERKRQLSFSPLLLPVGQSGYFCFLPRLPLLSPPSMALCLKTCSLFPLSLLSVSQPPLTSFSGPHPTSQRCLAVGTTFTAWLMQSEIPAYRVCFRISLCHPASFIRLSRFPRSHSEPPALILIHLPVGWTVSRSRRHETGEDLPCPRHW